MHGVRDLRVRHVRCHARAHCRAAHLQTSASSSLRGRGQMRWVHLLWVRCVRCRARTCRRAAYLQGSLRMLIKLSGSV